MTLPVIRPFLLVDDAEAAARFWVSNLPNSAIISINAFGTQGTSTVVLVTLIGQEFMVVSASEIPPSTWRISHMILVETQAEVDRIWDALCDGGEPGTCGWLTDKFGITWQVVPEKMQQLIVDPDPARAARANRAMMTMSKIDLAALEAAADSHD